MTGGRLVFKGSEIEAVGYLTADWDTVRQLPSELLGKPIPKGLFPDTDNAIPELPRFVCRELRVTGVVDGKATLEAVYRL